VDPKRIEEAITVILDEHRKIRNPKSEIRNSELKKAKEYLKGHMVLGLENSRSVAYFYAAQELLEKKIDDPDEIMKKIDAVTVEQVKNVAKKYFVEKGLSMAIIGNFPSASSEQVTSGQSFEKLLKL
jgi:predicted Zn-dependent peptidase